jgi:hypothetical protein
LLCNDREKENGLLGNSQLGKQVPTAMDMHAMVKVLLNYNNGNGVFYVVHAEMLYKQGQSSSVVVSCQQLS